MVASSLPLYLTLFLVFFLRLTDATSSKGVDPGNPVVDLNPSLLNAQLPNHGVKDVIYCERVKVSGHSRLAWRSYADAFRVTLAPSALISERLHTKIQVCFHRNDSLALCRCDKDEWTTLHKGIWSSVMSPYDTKYLDVKFVGQISCPVRISVEEDFQQWRIWCLAVGFLLLLLAPIVSSSVPFYYTSSMAIGVFLVVIILLFQGMKLLPTGRKNIFYLSIYGSVLGAGTYILHHISMLVNFILVNFGLSEEMHNPVYVFMIVGIMLAGAALGYWLVRKFVISKDGSVDVGVAQFVKWTMRITAASFIFLSTLDVLSAIVSFHSLYAVCYLINGLVRSHKERQSLSQGGRQVIAKQNRAEFLSKSSKLNPGEKCSPRSSAAWSNSPVKGLVSPRTHSGRKDMQSYISTFHSVQNRKKYSKKEWEEFTIESTQQAVGEWAASPEVATWLIQNADRIQLLPSDCSSEDTIGSESDSTDETIIGMGKKFCLFNW